MPTVGAGKALNQPFGYTGYQTDDVSGLYYAQARYYDAGVGRFAAEDIIKGVIHMPLTMNHYAYCWNSPLNLVDLNGQWPQFIKDIGNGVSNAISGVKNWYNELPDWGQNLVKVGIGVVAVGIGAVVVGATGGAALPALIAGVKTAAVIGTVSAGTNAAITATSSALSGDNLNTVLQKTGKAAFDGFSNGFMFGGIMSGASMLVNPLLQNSSGLRIGQTTNPNYGRVTIGYGNPKVNGSTLANISNRFAKSLFRLDFDPRYMLHLHFGTTKSAMALHRTGIIEVISGLLIGVFSNERDEETNKGCEQE